MNISGHDIGVCSWSLQPTGMADLVAQVRKLGLDHLQLAMGPLVELDEQGREREIGILRASGLTVTAAMMAFPGEDYSTIALIRDTGGFVPEATWPARRQMTLEAARLMADLGIKLLTVHVGFVPQSNHASYPVLLGRIRDLAAAVNDFGVELIMETGQEHAGELLQFINDLAARNVHVNFDPANMILYGAGDPIEAVRILGRHIRHVHVKDAILSSQPGIKWGDEVPFGTGQVGARAFLMVLKEVGYTGALAIEREAGNARFEDVRTAIRALQAVAI